LVSDFDMGACDAKRRQELYDACRCGGVAMLTQMAIVWMYSTMKLSCLELTEQGICGQFEAVAVLIVGVTEWSVVLRLIPMTISSVSSCSSSSRKALWRCSASVSIN
jgi:hypothetical protein